MVNSGLEMRHEGKEDIYRFDPEQSLAFLDWLSEHRTELQKPDQTERATDGKE